MKVRRHRGAIERIVERVTESATKEGQVVAVGPEHCKVKIGGGRHIRATWSGQVIPVVGELCLLARAPGRQQWAIINTYRDATRTWQGHPQTPATDGYVMPPTAGGNGGGSDFVLAHVRWVAEISDSETVYTSIQTAIDSISDASATDQYTVLVAPGTYTEDITIPAYVSVVSLGGRRETKIVGTVTFSANVYSGLKGFQVGYSSATAIVIADSATSPVSTITIQDCYIWTQGGNPVVTIGDYVVVELWDCAIRGDETAASAITIAGASTAYVYFDNCWLLFKLDVVISNPSAVINFSSVRIDNAATWPGWGGGDLTIVSGAKVAMDVDTIWSSITGDYQTLHTTTYEKHVFANDIPMNVPALLTDPGSFVTGDLWLSFDGEEMPHEEGEWFLWMPHWGNLADTNVRLKAAYGSQIYSVQLTPE